MERAATDTAAIDRPPRPLSELVPLIKEDIRQARDAAERAGMPYYMAAGEKLLEAKAQLQHGEFQAWVQRHFSITLRHARRYMALAAHTRKNGPASPFSSLGDFIRQTGPDPEYNTSASRMPAWHQPVKIVGRVEETLNLKRNEWQRIEERDAQRKLALRLINIGYKALARTLHPDAGGSREAMVQLNAVRRLLLGMLSVGILTGISARASKDAGERAR